MCLHPRGGASGSIQALTPSVDQQAETGRSANEEKLCLKRTGSPASERGSRPSQPGWHGRLQRVPPPLLHLGAQWFAGKREVKFMKPRAWQTPLEGAQLETSLPNQLVTTFEINVTATSDF